MGQYVKFIYLQPHQITKQSGSVSTGIGGSVWPEYAVDSTEYDRTMAIGRIQSNVNPFIFDPSLVERCFCVAHPDKPAKTYTVNIYPNPSKGLFFIDIPDYKGPVIMKISDASGKLVEKHHLRYAGLISWRLNSGYYKVSFAITNSYSVILDLLIF
jgi:hypothetical protein